MRFQVKPLSSDLFENLYGKDDDYLSSKGARRVYADASPGYPCRVSLQDAELGEPLLLLNFQHQKQGTAYQSTHAIFVREGAAEFQPELNEVPEVLSSRLLSVRAFDHRHDMVDAEVVEGNIAERVFRQFLNRDEVSYLHVHNAKPGCFAALVERA